MSVRGTPEQASLAFVQAINGGNLDGAVSCFAEDARFLTPDGTVIHGRSQIRGVLDQLLALRIRIKVETRRMLIVGDTALGSERWTTRFQRPDGSSYQQVSVSTVVFGRADDGWELLINAPWGWELKGAEGHSELVGSV